MHGGCEDYAWDLRGELAALETERTRITSLTEQGPFVALSPALRPLDVRLHPIQLVSLAGLDEKKRRPTASFAGMFMVTVPKNGIYRVSSNVPAWIEMVSGASRLEPEGFEMQTACAKLFKSVAFRLRAGTTYWLEVSANSAEVVILITADSKREKEPG